MKKLVIAYLLLFGLLCTFVGNAAMAAPKKRIYEIEYETSDKFVLVSKLTYPKEKKKRYPMVVLLHSIGYSSEEWNTLPIKFNAAGFAVLEIDLKGHGASTNDIYFKKRSWIYLNEKDYKQAPKEVLGVVNQVIAEREDILASFVSYVGADLGANIAIHTSEMQNPKPVCVALISPYVLFKGLYTPVKLSEMGTVPVLFMAAEKDGHSMVELKRLFKYAQGEREQKIYPNGGTGMVMLKINPTMENDIVNWVVEQYNKIL